MFTKRSLSTKTLQSDETQPAFNPFIRVSPLDFIYKARNEIARGVRNFGREKRRRTYDEFVIIKAIRADGECDRGGFYRGWPLYGGVKHTRLYMFGLRTRGQNRKESGEKPTHARC